LNVDVSAYTNNKKVDHFAITPMPVVTVLHYHLR